ncbi:MAG TPA: FdhF/YdeP family oxidoreductase, partial [Planctomycetota bacterium]|nr:FdhF/YdeP family oxidoreductase [Planctomycetota bacterium]
FDCPGCAWPEGADRGAFEFCENGAKAIAAETTSKLCGSSFFREHAIDALRARSDYWLEQQGRLVHPMYKAPGATHYAPIAWHDAFQVAARALKATEPDRVAFYTSGRTSNEAAFLWQLLGRAYGTNNFPDCSNLCHESSGVALTRTVGHGKGTVQLADFDLADAIFVIGQNPGTNHPRMLATLLKARRRGARIVAINPLVERGLSSFVHPQEPWSTVTGKGVELATTWLRPKVGADVAVLKGVMKHVLAAERAAPGSTLDREFLEAHTVGFDAFAADLDATTWEEIAEASGLGEAELRAAADVYLGAKNVIVCWAMGLTQHENALDNVAACVNLALMRGHLGRPGAGLCPVRGHSNVQGDRTVGVNHAPSEEFLAALERAVGFVAPRTRGLDVVDALKAADEGRLDVFLGMGGNLAQAAPDTALAHRALGRLKLTVQIATKLNRTMLCAGDEAMIWPCLARSERDLQAAGPQRTTVEDSMSCVHASEGRLAPKSPELKSEPAIVAGLGKALLGPRTPVDWDALAGDYRRIRDLIARVLPAFEGYEGRLDDGGFVLRHPVAHREWRTRSGKAEFTVTPVPRIRLAPGELRLFTVRSHDQYNTTIYGLDDRYRGVRGLRRVVFVHPEDLRERGLAPGDAVDLVSRFKDGVERVAPGFRVVAFDVPRECAAAYFPETNALVPLDHVSRGSNQPAFKMIPTSLRPAANG